MLRHGIKLLHNVESENCIFGAKLHQSDSKPDQIYNWFRPESDMFRSLADPAPVAAVTAISEQVSSLAGWHTFQSAVPMSRLPPPGHDPVLVHDKVVAA